MMRRTTVFLALLALPALAAAQDYDCLIEARQTVDIRSPVEGLLENVAVDRGDVVRKGQVLVTLGSGPERAARAIARSRATMTGPVEATQARVEYAKTKEKRQEELYRQDFVSSSALDEDRTEGSSSSPADAARSRPLRTGARLALVRRSRDDRQG